MQFGVIALPAQAHAVGDPGASIAGPPLMSAASSSPSNVGKTLEGVASSEAPVARSAHVLLRPVVLAGGERGRDRTFNLVLIPGGSGLQTPA
jgi:hypothetical protein